MRSFSRRIAPVAIAVLAVFAGAQAAPASRAATTKPATTQKAAPSALKTDRQKLSYAFGMKLGNDLLGMLDSSKGDLDPTTVLAAINTSLAHGQSELTIPEAQSRLEAYQKVMEARRTAEQAKKPAPAYNPTATEKHQLSYALGMQLGGNLEGMLAQWKQDMDRPIVLRGLNAMASHAPTELTVPEAQAQLQAFGKVMEQRQKAEAAQQASENAKLARQNQSTGAAFLASNGKKPGVKTTASGLQYQVLKMGTGPKPKSSDRVKVNYAGSLLDGTEFDSSAKNGGPVVLSLGGVIPGWTEGLQLMPVGSKFVFWIPGKLAYGDRGSPPAIGPDATLKFEVELLSIQ